MTAVYGARRLTYAEVVKLSLRKTLERSRPISVQIADSATQTEVKSIDIVKQLVSPTAHTTKVKITSRPSTVVRKFNQQRRKRTLQL